MLVGFSLPPKKISQAEWVLLMNVTSMIYTSSVLIDQRLFWQVPKLARNMNRHYSITAELQQKSFVPVQCVFETKGIRFTRNTPESFNSEQHF